MAGDAAPPQILNALIFINNKDQFIPMYKLQKVSDDTPIKYSTAFPVLSGIKKYFTPKNVVIGLVSLAAVYGILKFTKIIK